MASSGFNTRMVRDLAKILRENDLTEIEVDHDGTRITVTRNIAMAQTVQMAAPMMAAPAPMPAAAPVQAAPAAPAVAVPAPAAPAAGPEPGTIPSPMVGTVYLQAEPGSPPFVKAGDVVKEGQRLFIIEAMKTMNPVTAPRAGTVTKILVSDAQPVEYGEGLCVIA